MSTLMDRILKNSKTKMSAPLADSRVFEKKDMASTPVPMINVALSGKIDGGLSPGLLMLAGPSKHFKTAFTLLMIASWQKKYPDGIVLFYDSEFGSPQSYFESFGVDLSRVVHTPIMDIEGLKFDIMGQLDALEKNDRICIAIDSIGNLASKKEVEDALNDKSVADMTRARQLKSLFRMITPHLTLKNIPLIAINHTYKEISLYPKDIVSGGTGGYYSSNDIWIIGRQQEKEGTEVSGYNFIINIEKSRNVKEKSKIPISVSYDGGISKWSGLFDVALEGGYIVKPQVGWYEAVDPSTGEVLTDSKKRQKELADNKEFWLMMLDKTDLAKYIEKRYSVASGAIMRDEDVEATSE